MERRGQDVCENRDVQRGTACLHENRDVRVKEGQLGWR
jgi:hypothetical protein